MNPSIRILLVDDESSIRLTLAALLERAGYNVYSAENGEEALEWLARQQFDMLVADLKMPGMQGMDVVSAAQQRQPDIVVIVLTGHGSLDTAIQSLHQGVFDYLLKTSDPASVVERVRAGIEERSQRLRRRALLDAVSSAVQEIRGSQAEVTTNSTQASRNVVIVGMLQLDTWRQEGVFGERTLTLTPTEFRVLLCLAEHAGTMVTYTALVQSAQGYAASELEASELIKPHIHHLRQKLEPEPSNPRYLLNVRGKGYLFSPTGG